ncbi:MAG: glycosyltransferase family 2 protein [Chitinophagaceae bacterium]|nr:MAG: glycosyltransferase family 2 protein [Chitinophagaceae bacterium]
MIYVLHYIFWICLGIIFYNYIGYGILLALISGMKHIIIRLHTFYAESGKYGSTKPTTNNPSTSLRVTQRTTHNGQPDFPEVTLVIAAYNEEAVIEEKIANCLQLNYPKDKLSFLFITDGSTDGTADVVRRYPQIYLLDSPERKGKTAALNRAMQYVSTPITIFCDANTMLNRSAIRKIAAHYRSPKTGGVAGEKKVLSGENDTAPAAGEGLYWKYESLLKRLDASLYTVTGAAGELFSIRTTLWAPMPENVILDDFVISTRINLKGYRIAYEPHAYACELSSASLEEEKKRKVRISAGGFQSMVMLKEIFNVFRHPVLFFQFVSHRFLRWTLTPLSLPLLLLANILLVASGAGRFYKIMLMAQLAFYLLAGMGRLFGETKRLKILKIFHYILFMNYSVYAGFFRFIKGKQSGVWEKAERKVMVIS